jgi:hypothetical protein
MPMNPRLLRPLAKARTLYFNGAVDSNWNTLGNWWTSGAFTTQATTLPTSSDSVVLSATCETNSGSAPTVVNLTCNDPNNDGLGINIAITVTGNATFNDISFNYGTVTGNATFNDGSYNNGTVTGNATFNNISYNYYGTVTGDATFNGSSYNGSDSIVGGDATFNNSSVNAATVTGNATFNGSSFNDYGSVTGDATFNDGSINFGDVGGTATFTGSACNDGGTAGEFVPNPPPSCP